MDKKSFILFTDRKKEIDMLSDAKCGILFKAIFQYVDTGEELETEDLTLRVLFSFLVSQIDENMEKWEETRKRRSDAGKKGGAPKGNRNAEKQTKTSKNKLKQAKQAVTVTDTVTGTVTVSDIPQDSIVPDGTLLPAQRDEVIPWDEIDFELV